MDSSALLPEPLAAGLVAVVAVLAVSVRRVGRFVLAFSAPRTSASASAARACASSAACACACARASARAVASASSASALARASSAACSASAASASALARASSFADVRALGIVLSGRLAGRLGRGGVTLGRRLRRCHRPWAGGQRDGSHRGLALVVSTSSGEGREMMGLGRGGGWNRRARRLGLAALAVLWQRRHSRWRHARLALSILRRESTRWCS